MSEWKEYRLEEITSKIGSGATPKGGSNNYKEIGISLIRSQNVLDFKFSSSGLAFIDDDQAEELKNVTIQKNDILFNITGDSVARCCIVPIDVLPARVNQHVAIIRVVDELAIYSFVSYYLQYIKPELLINAEIGATRNAITKSMLEQLEIILPPLPEQRAIASVLSSLDDKIDLLHRQNATFEKMAETLFKQWFVEEAKGEWRMGILGDLVDILSGYAFKSSSFVESGKYRLITIKAVQDGYLELNNADRINELPYKIPDHCLLTYGDILLSLTGNVGRCCLVTDSNLLLNQRVAKLKAKRDSDWAFVYTLFRQEVMRKTLEEMAKGTAQANLSPIETRDMEFQIPPSDLLNRFSQIMTPFIEKVISNKFQIRTLTQLRDTLLPKLVSGEVRVEM
jgi:type I restriction enzyme S subunit